MKVEQIMDAKYKNVNIYFIQSGKCLYFYFCEIFQTFSRQKEQNCQKSRQFPDFPDFPDIFSNSRHLVKTCQPCTVQYPCYPYLKKIIEKLMHKRLYSFMEENNILYHKQFGFSKGNSTINA